MNDVELAIRFLMLLMIGIIFMLAGIFKWKIPSIHWFLREQENGETINMVAMLILGICLFGAAFDVLF